MGKEINLLINYPRVKRDIQYRGSKKTKEDRLIARKFGKDFFMDRVKSFFNFIVFIVLSICIGWFIVFYLTNDIF